MKLIRIYIIVLFSICFYKTLEAQQPQLFLIDANKVAAIKKSIKNNETLAKNIAELIRQSDKLVKKEFGSVMDKKFTPPCGNMHEYMSMARYYWYDSSKSDGKPYIKKDGQKNPEVDKISDDKNFDGLIAAVHTLSFAYYFTDDEKYAAKATQLIRFWFLDTATMMFPNLNHAQTRTGIDTGVSTGIIDTHNLPDMLDAIGLLRSYKQWNNADERGIKKWFEDYLEWFLKSDNGKKEREAKNNHGTFYNVQAVPIALFCNKKSVANDLLKKAFDRLDKQIEPDGKQPLELLRTLALSYSIFNLRAWFTLAEVAEKTKIDFWNYEAKSGGSLKKAIDYLIPFVVDGKPFEYKQINKYKPQDLYVLLLIAAEKFNDEKYIIAAAKIKDSNKNILVKVLYE